MVADYLTLVRLHPLLMDGVNFKEVQDAVTETLLPLDLLGDNTTPLI